MSLTRILRSITSSPLNRDRKLAAVLRFLKWQIGCRLVPGEILVNWVGEAKFIAGLGESGLTGNIYNGLHEFPDMAYVLHALDESDCFVDVGANVGSYTLLACAVAGARGVCFEPVPQTYERLVLNLAVNRLQDRVGHFNQGLGDREGLLRFTTDENCMNHVLAPDETAEHVVEVPVVRLDAALSESPTMVKIDVEGFETMVLKGAQETLAHDGLHSLLIELNGSGERYGYDEGKIVDLLAGFGFLPYQYDPLRRHLTSLPVKNTTSGNTLFIRDIQQMRERVQAAPTFRVLGKDV